MEKKNNSEKSKKSKIPKTEVTFFFIFSFLIHLEVKNGIFKIITPSTLKMECYFFFKEMLWLWYKDLSTQISHSYMI